MTADELVREVINLGVVLGTDGKHLRLRPKSAIPLTLVPELRAHKEEILELLLLAPWPPESVAAEQRLGQPYARLLPFVGRCVSTDLGRGKLIQLQPDRAAVVLERSPGRLTWLLPEELRPLDSTNLAWNGICRALN